MRKIIAIIVMVLLIGGLYFYFTNVSNQLNNKAENKVLGISEETILFELDKNYDEFMLKIWKLQENPDQITELNCMITKMLYSGKLKDEEIMLLLKVQRTYYTDQTLAKNPEEVNYQRLLKELENFKEADVNIIGYKIVGPQYVDFEEGDKKMLIFNVIYYLNITTDEGEVYKGYVFQQNEDKLWELKGFGAIESFPIIY